jgi:hypothetical protein
MRENIRGNRKHGFPWTMYPRNQLKDLIYKDYNLDKMIICTTQCLNSEINGNKRTQTYCSKRESDISLFVKEMTVKK